jgi:hypothetical protein
MTCFDHAHFHRSLSVFFIWLLQEGNPTGLPEMFGQLGRAEGLELQARPEDPISRRRLHDSSAFDGSLGSAT